MEKEWFVYILACNDGTLYTGVTTDISRRIIEHNTSEKWAKYTRARRPVVLVYQEKCISRSTACAREYAIKQLSKLDKESLIKSAK